MTEDEIRAIRIETLAMSDEQILALTGKWRPRILVEFVHIRRGKKKKESPTFGPYQQTWVDFIRGEVLATEIDEGPVLFRLATWDPRKKGWEVNGIPGAVYSHVTFKTDLRSKPGSKPPENQ